MSSVDFNIYSICDPISPPRPRPVATDLTRAEKKRRWEVSEFSAERRARLESQKDILIKDQEGIILELQAVNERQRLEINRLRRLVDELSARNDGLTRSNTADRPPNLVEDALRNLGERAYSWTEEDSPSPGF